MPHALEGRIALVTGASRGIGKTISLTLAGAGADLIVVARSSIDLEETRDAIVRLGCRAVVCAADVSERAEVIKAVSRGLGAFGQIDILVNNAGIQPPIGPLVDNDSDEWIKNISVNLFGTFHFTQAVLPSMIARQRGKIINLSGGGATSPRPNFSAYATSKAGIVRLTETLAEEVKRFNIQVNVIAPGAVNTRMLDEVLEAGVSAGDEWASAQKRKDQGGMSSQMASDLVLFLASDASDGLTGNLISAPHDNWRDWDETRMMAISNSAWYTLRRLDPHTINTLKELK